MITKETTFQAPESQDWATPENSGAENENSQLAEKFGRIFTGLKEVHQEIIKNHAHAEPLVFAKKFASLVGDNIDDITRKKLIAFQKLARFSPSFRAIIGVDRNDNEVIVETENIKADWEAMADELEMETMEIIDPNQNTQTSFRYQGWKKSQPGEEPKDLSESFGHFYLGESIPLEDVQTLIERKRKKLAAEKGIDPDDIDKKLAFALPDAKQAGRILKKLAVDIEDGLIAKDAKVAIYYKSGTDKIGIAVLAEHNQIKGYKDRRETFISPAGTEVLGILVASEKTNKPDYEAQGSLVAAAD